MYEDQEAAFMTLCLQGTATVQEIDDFVDRWHDGASTLSLREFLGMSASEYALWVNAPDALPDIIATRKAEASVSSS